MDPQVLAFLNRITYSIGIALLWMVSNTTIGIMWGYAFMQDHWRWSNTFFYIYLLSSLGGLLYGLYQLWKTPIQFDN